MYNADIFCRKDKWRPRIMDNSICTLESGNSDFCFFKSWGLTLITVFFFFLCLLWPDFIGNRFQKLRLFVVGSHKGSSLGGAGWCFRWTQVPFSLVPFLFWSFSFMHFRELSLLLEYLIFSICPLILLAGILPLTCLFTTMPTACEVTL